MKDSFPGYCRKSESEIKNIWQNGIIMFDTNVLLNLYRYSKATRETIVELIGKFKDQIWLPHQAALEYNKNRYEVIADQEKAYKEFTEKIIQIQKDLQTTSKPPFLSEKVHSELNQVFEKVNSEVDESITKYGGYLKEDPIYTELGSLFENRITEAFEEEELKKIFNEGEERFKNKIPPGYEDEKNKTENRKYGDLVLWKQVISKSKELGKPVLLVTDERKTDWWWKIKDGRNMGPRHELVAEIKKEANVDFHMYSSERFLSYGQTYLQEKVNEQALKEIEAMKKAEIEEIIRLKHIAKIKDKESAIDRKGNLKRLFRERDEIRLRLNDLTRHLEMIKPDVEENPAAMEYFDKLTSERHFLKMELRELNQRLHDSDFERKRLRRFFEDNDGEQENN